MAGRGELSKADYEALAAFRATLRRFLRVSEENARREGITPQQHQLLLVVKGQSERDWATVGELADALQIRHHAAVGLVDRCEYAGFVHREPDPRDRRQVRVVITPEGEAVLARLAHSNRDELMVLREALHVPFLE